MWIISFKKLRLLSAESLISIYRSSNIVADLQFSGDGGNINQVYYSTSGSGDMVSTCTLFSECDATAFVIAVVVV